MIRTFIGGAYGNRTRCSTGVFQRIGLQQVGFLSFGDNNSDINVLSARVLVAMHSHEIRSFLQ
jgi:hypothetical protein